MNRMNTKSVVQGAMIAALFGMLSLFNTYTGGLIDIFICYCMVVPIAWYGNVYDIKMNILVVIASLIVILMFGTPFFIISSVSALLIGLFLGETIKRKSKKEIILLGTFLLCLMNNIFIYQVFSGLLGIDIISEITVMIDDLKVIYPLLSQISQEMILKVIPIVLIIMSMMEMYIIILMCQLIFMRLKISFPSQFHIAFLHFSIKTGIILFVGMIVCYVLIHVFNIDYLLLNYLYLLISFAFLLQGFSFMNYYALIKRKRMIILFSFVLFVIPYGYSILIILGIIDIFSDLRKKLLYNKDN